MKKLYVLVLVLIMMASFTSCGSKGISDSKCLEDFVSFDSEYTYVDFESFETVQSLEDEEENSYYIQGILKGSDAYADYEIDVSLWYLDYDQGWELEDATVNSVYMDVHTGRTPEEIQYGLDNDDIWGSTVTSWKYVSDTMEDYDNDGEVEQVVVVEWEKDNSVSLSKGTTTIYYEYEGDYWEDEEMDDLDVDETYLKLEGKTYESETGHLVLKVVDVPESGDEEVTIKFLKSSYTDRRLVENGELTGRLVDVDYGNYVHADGFYDYKFDYQRAYEDGSLHDDTFTLSFAINPDDGEFCCLDVGLMSDTLYE